MTINHLFASAICVSQFCFGAQSAISHVSNFPGQSGDQAAIVASENIILLRPNLLNSQAIPLGNGSLGIAVWSQDGMTLQLNRADTMPDRLSPGKVILPGLSRLTTATDYKAYLDLYNGEFVESGGGMTARVYVESSTDTVVVAVSGASPGVPQSATLTLWSPRNPKALVMPRYGALAETWADDKQPGASGLTFGSLAAITALGTDTHATIKGPRTVELTFKPDAKGQFTLRVAAPGYNGKTSPSQILGGKFSSINVREHRAWWHQFWARAALIQASSPDGEAQYMANLRDLYLFYAAAERGTTWPGSQAGIADMLSAVGDAHMWDPAAFWHWNLRMMTAANLAAGVPDLNASYFNLYRDTISAVQTWTQQHMAQRPGICVPETMRFNGPGFEFEQWDKSVTALNCAADSPPYYNARTLSTGAEVSLWIWQQYLATDDMQFLQQNYPVMRESARFLLSYQKLGKDGLLHTSPSNAHETQWDVTDPTTDIVGIRTLFTNTVEAASLLHQDAAMVMQLRAALLKLPQLPSTTTNKSTTLLSPGNTARNSIIAPSYLPASPQHNVENIGLEPVWPYGLIGEDSQSIEEAKRTFFSRPYPLDQDWSYDPIQAARLGLRAEVAGTLAALTDHYQVYPNGLASWGGHSGEFYIEQSGVVADALSEALVQDYDGVIRIAPGVPAEWTMEGSVAIQHRGTVRVRVAQGYVDLALISPGASGNLSVQDPWSDGKCTITDIGTKQTVASGSGRLTFTALRGHTYSVQHAGAITGSPSTTRTVPAPATQPRHFKSRTIGLDLH